MSQMSELIVELRKKKQLTQKELADALGVTDKAVSKWETGRSCPDTALLPHLAKMLDTTTDELLFSESIAKKIKKDEMKGKIKKQINLILKAVALAMGVALFVLNVISEINVKDSVGLISIAIFCLALSAFSNE